MKRLNSHRRWYIKRQWRKRIRRAAESKRKAYSLRFAKTGQPGQCPSRRTKWQRDIRVLDLRAPAQFGLLLDRNSRCALLQFLAALRRLTLDAKMRVRINFNETRKMFPDGTLLFAAELDRINRATAPRRLISCNYPVDNVVEQLLQHLGLLKMMARRGKARITADNVRHWRFTTDTRVEGARTEPWISEYEKYFSGNDSSKLYDGLVEAMTNCVHHAYTQKRKDNTNLKNDIRWWMFSQMKNDLYTVAFCDLGIGIKNSLLEGKKWPVALVLRAVGAMRGDDSAYIRTALKLGSSKTAQENRGKGLQDIQNVIKSIGKGAITILSNKGMWSYSPTVETPEKYEDYADSILGTLILWQVPLTKAG